MSDGWLWMTAEALGHGIGRGAIDARELTEVYLAAIEGHPQGNGIYARTTPERTLIDVFRASVVEFPDAVALEDAQGGLSYRRLEKLVAAQAAELGRAGVRRGDRVGIRIASGTREL